MIRDYIAAFTVANGYAPSVREIAPAVGLSSISSVHHHMRRLQEAGLIDTVSATARAVRVIRDAPNRPAGTCQRPGCGKAAKAHGRRSDKAPTKWCSPTCAAKAAAVKHWVRAAGAEHVLTEIGL